MRKDSFCPICKSPARSINRKADKALCPEGHTWSLLQQARQNQLDLRKRPKCSVEGCCETISYSHKKGTRCLFHQDLWEQAINVARNRNCYRKRIGSSERFSIEEVFQELLEEGLED